MDKIFYNEASAAKLGWEPDWFGAEEIDENLMGPNCIKSHTLMSTKSFLIEFSNISGQKALVLDNLLNQENFNESQNSVMSTTPRPPFISDIFAWSLLTLSGLPPQRKLNNNFSGPFKWIESFARL